MSDDLRNGFEPPPATNVCICGKRRWSVTLGSKHIAGRSLLMLGVACASPACTPAVAASKPAAATTLSASHRAAVAAAENWLTWLDAEDFERIWNDIPEELKGQSNRQTIEEGLRGQRRDWSVVEARTLRGLKKVNVRGQDGLALLFDTRLQARRAALEEVLLVRHNGRWVVGGYGSFKPNESIDSFDEESRPVPPSLALPKEPSPPPYVERVPTPATHFEVLTTLAPAGWTFPTKSSEGGYWLSASIDAGVSVQRTSYILTCFGGYELALNSGGTFRGGLWALTRTGFVSAQAGALLDVSAHPGLFAGIGVASATLEYQHQLVQKGQSRNSLLVRLTIPWSLILHLVSDEPNAKNE